MTNLKDMIERSLFKVVGISWEDILAAAVELPYQRKKWSSENFKPADINALKGLKVVDGNESTEVVICLWVKDEDSKAGEICWIYDYDVDDDYTDWRQNKPLKFKKGVEYLTGQVEWIYDAWEDFDGNPDYEAYMKV